MVVYEEHELTRKTTKKMHFKYWEKYVKIAWETMEYSGLREAWITQEVMSSWCAQVTN